MSTSDGDIYVNYNSVMQVEETLQSAEQQVSAVLQDLADVIRPLVESWQGSAQEMYAQVQQKWSSDMSDMQSVLSRYAPTLDEMKVNYSTTDNNLAQQWSAIQ